MTQSFVKKKGTLYGVAINDAGYNIADCPYYKTWSELVRRCYSEKEKERHKTYKDASMSKDWLLFSNFKAWMQTQPWMGNDLDKDILVKDNKHYSPETCVFVPSYINTLLVTSAKIRGNWPLGVNFLADDYIKGRVKIFRASIKNKRSKVIQKNLGHFRTSPEAHKAWQVAKCAVFEERLAEYREHPAYMQEVEKALRSRLTNIKLDIALGRETLTI